MHEVIREVRNRGFGRRAGITLAGPLAAGLVAMALPLISGCASRSPAEAENREVRLTQDGVVKFSPRFSPDGAWIAYAAVTGQNAGALGVYVIPRQGGAARKISPDTVNAFPIGWSGDGAGVFCRSMEGRGIYRVGLNGTTESLDPGDPFARPCAISPDGKTMIELKFNQDNRDVGIHEEGGEFRLLASTPVWEEEAVFGPGQGEVTVVATPSYQAPTSTISVWSPKTRAFTALPLPEGMKSQPAWSPDGHMLAYCYHRDGQTDLWLYDAKSAKSAPLTEDLEDSGSPTWAPDGDWLGFCRSTKVSHIYAGDPRKGNRRQITAGADYDFSATVSKDGKWVAFFRRLASGDERGKTVLCVVPVAGGPVRRVDLKGLSLPSKAGDAISWSPDSHDIAFQASEGPSRMDIYRIGRDGTGLARVTVEPGDEIEPRWSPDGRTIAYTRVGGGQTRVAVVPATGGLPRVISQEGVLSEGGMVSPRGDRMVYASFRLDGSSELWMAPLAAPEKRTRVMSSKVVVWPEIWSNDGKDVLVMRGQGSTWHVVAYSADGGTESVVGRAVMLPSGKDMYADFTPEGAKYEELFYPGGIVVADGQDRSDLFLIRARMPVKSTALYMREDRFLCSGFVGLAGCF
jgi:TolB protein